MRHISLAAALAFSVSLIALAPAKAELNGPTHNDQGLCKKTNSNNHNGVFFYWAACPTPAAATITAPARRHHHRG